MLRSFSVVAVFCVLVLSVVSESKAIVIYTDNTWRDIAPVGNLERQPIDSVGLNWELAHPGWNSDLGFNDSDSAGWHTSTAISGDNYIWDITQNTPTYFRKTFTITGTPTLGDLFFEADDDGQIYINGHLAVNDNNGILSIETADVTSFLVEGQNLIAVKAQDSYGGNQFLYVSLNVPEPSTLILLASGAFGLFIFAWRRRKS